MKKIILLTIILLTSFKTFAQCWSVVSAGYNHSLAIKSDGTLWAWGASILGDGTYDNKNYPIQIGNDNNWKAIVAGFSHSLAIKTDGTLWAWGYNYSGELGDGTHQELLVPTQIGNLTNWRTVSASGSSSFAIKIDGTMWAWGYNSQGVLGLGNSDSQDVPNQIGTANNWKSVECGYNHAVALKTNSTLWSWGSSIGTGVGMTPSPIQVGTDNNWIKLLVGRGYTVALKSNGTLWAWGKNDYGQLGDGTIVDKYVPTPIASTLNWQELTHTATNFNFGIKLDGTLWAWGYGELGDGTNNYSNTPIQIGIANNWYSVSVKFNHTLAIQTDGTLWAWGDNFYGQLGIGSNEANLIPTQVSCNNLKNPSYNLVRQNVIYPNPTNQLLNVQNINSQPIEGITIADTTGKIVINQSGNLPQINVQDLQPGIYFIQIQSQGKTITQKFIKV